MLLGFLAELVWSAAEVEDTSSWTLSLNDRLALSTYKFFKTNPTDKIDYWAVDNNTKILSRDPLMVKEFVPGCKYMNRRDRYSTSRTNAIAAICSDNQLWEVEVDPATGKLKNHVQLASFAQDKCFQSEYYKDLDVYAVFCFRKQEGVAGFYYLHIVDRANKKTIGSASRNLQDVNSTMFQDVIKIRAVTIPKGAMKSSTVFFIYDESLPDASDKIVGKQNSFILMADIDPSTKQPQPMQILDLMTDASFKATGFRKALSYEVIDEKLHAITFDNNGAIQMFRCNLDITTYLLPKAACTPLKHELKMLYGVVRLTKHNILGVYNKFENKVSFCTYSPADPTNVAKNCRVFENSRQEADLDIKSIESYNSSVAFIYYINKRGQNMSLGVDKVNLTETVASKALLDRFKDLSNDDLEINDMYYALTDAYIDVYSSTRTLEMVLESKLLIPDRSFRFDILMQHEGVKKVKELKGNKIAKFLDKITQTVAFPKLVGFLKNTFRIPLGRTFYSGNGISFDLVVPKANSSVTNAGDASLIINNIRQGYLVSYFHSYHYQVAMVNGQKFMVLRCTKLMEGGFVMNCTNIQEINIVGDTNETVIGTIESPQLFAFVTSRATVYIVSKTALQPEKSALTIPNLIVESVAFREKDTIFIVVLVVKDTITNKYAINIYEIHKFKMTFRSVQNITEFAAGSAQEKGGVFCPKSVRFEIDPKPILVVLNACKDTDRRIIRFDFSAFLPVQISNTYIRVPEFKTENIQMCPDTHTLIVASPGTSKSVGIGYESHQMQMDLSLDELRVVSITKLVCLGEKAFALGFFDDKKIFKIATYFTGKMPFADNRLHSVLNFTDLGEYKDFTGSEGDGYVFFNVYSKDPANNKFKAVYLNGPDFYVRSDSRMVINDATVLTGNGNVNEVFNLMLMFVPQQQQTYAYSRTKKTPIVKNKVVDIDVSCLVEGPVFNWQLPSTAVATVTSRLQNFGDPVPARYGTADGTYIYCSQIATAMDTAFALMQTNDASVLHVTNNKTGVFFFVELKIICNKLRVLDTGNTFSAHMNCISDNEWRFHVFQFSKSTGALTKKYVSNVTMKCQMFDVEETGLPNHFLTTAIDERNNLFLWWYNAADVQGEKLSYFPTFNFTDGRLSLDCSEQRETGQNR